ncbi:zinc finger protein 449-like [Saccopteryx leptura]|uniref:zinc finger protein 449-like n=1 Tax=Saccopteryx leptura TaxID=249018 RepID=UPI00339D20DF
MTLTSSKVLQIGPASLKAGTGTKEYCARLRKQGDSSQSLSVWCYTKRGSWTDDDTPGLVLMGHPQSEPDPAAASERDLQDCKEVQQLLELLDFKIDRNALLGPSSPEDSEEPKTQLENHTEQLPGDHALPVDDWNPFPGDRAQRSNKEQPLSSSALEQNSVQKQAHRCIQCGKCFVSKKVLKGHLRIHSGELPHECLECGKRFLRKSNLQRHLRVHSREAPYKCSACEKRFTRASQLMEHQETSSPQGVYTCPDCRSQFCVRKYFMQHQKSHTTVKPHKCHSCGKRFSQKRDLHVHHMAHTAERPFVCEQCGKSYRQKSSLAFHLRNHPRGEAIVLQAS